jgi:hypothetical protein
MLNNYRKENGNEKGFSGFTLDNAIDSGNDAGLGFQDN